MLAQVVRKCSSFVIACQAFETKRDRGAWVLSDLTQEQVRARQVHKLSDEIRRCIAFQRIWCLAEVIAALDSELAIVMKTGWMVDSDTGGKGFLGDCSMCHAVAELVDVRQALMGLC